MASSPNPQLQRTPGPGDEMLEEVWNTSRTYDEFIARIQEIDRQERAEHMQKLKQQQAEKHQGDNVKGDDAGSGSQTNRPVIKKHGKEEKKQEKLRKRDQREQRAVEKHRALPPGRLEPGTFKTGNPQRERPAEPLVPGAVSSSASSSSRPLPKARFEY